MKKKWFVAIAVLIVIVAGGVIATTVLRSNTVNSNVLEIARVVRRDIGSTVLATGIIKPMVGAEVKVGSRISGVVKRLRANIGDHVKAGQLIAELDDAELRARLNQNFAALAKAQADLEFARSTFERTTTLRRKELVSEQESDQAETSVKVAEAQLKQADANLEYARVQLSYTRIYSPTSGVIASVSTQEGEAVSASLASPTFVSIIDLHRLEVQAYVDETDVGKVQIRQNVTFTVDTYPDTDFKGVVTAIYPKAVIQDNVVNYIVTVAISDSEGKTLRPEMTTNMTISLETRKNVLSAPTSAITRERGERYVTVLEGENKIQRKVKTGWKDNGITEIISGLNEGEQILVPLTNQENNP
ncbi:MAG: efflux RND transporter periplasmic adaptor subunit [Ignavibacteriae bacterium]|nr:efflux RND transporter periplasmic adaptor subunit [Ignavibacteriota bacterium]